MSADRTTEAFFDNTRNVAIRTSAMPRLNWPVLLTGMLIALLLPASIHVYMLSVLRIPYPDGSHVPQWVSSLNNICSILALAIFYQLARPKLERLSLFRQCLVVGALYVMIKQEILAIVMGGVFSTAYTYNFLAGIPQLLYIFFAGCLTVLVGFKVRGSWQKTVGTVLMAGVLVGAIHPLLIQLFAPFLKSISYLDHADVYGVPLGLHVLLPAYALTTEVVVGCMVVAALIWQRLSSAPMVRLLQFALIVMFIKGEALRGTLDPFYLPFKLPLAFLSSSQFFMEWIALSVLTALTWQLSQRSES